jgi:hypothetical protein
MKWRAADRRTGRVALAVADCGPAGVAPKALGFAGVFACAAGRRPTPGGLDVPVPLGPARLRAAATPCATAWPTGARLGTPTTRTLDPAATARGSTPPAMGNRRVSSADCWCVSNTWVGTGKGALPGVTVGVAIDGVSIRVSSPVLVSALTRVSGLGGRVATTRSAVACCVGRAMYAARKPNAVRRRATAPPKKAAVVAKPGAGVPCRAPVVTRAPSWMARAVVRRGRVGAGDPPATTGRGDVEVRGAVAVRAIALREEAPTPTAGVGRVPAPPGAFPDGIAVRPGGPPRLPPFPAAAVRSRWVSIGPAAATSGWRRTRTTSPTMPSAICPGAALCARDWLVNRKPRGGSAEGAAVAAAGWVSGVAEAANPAVPRRPIVGVAGSGAPARFGAHQRGGRTSAAPTDAAGVMARPLAGPRSARRIARGRARPIAKRADELARLPIGAGRGKPNGGPGGRKRARTARPSAVRSTLPSMPSGSFTCARS